MTRAKIILAAFFVVAVGLTVWSVVSFQARRSLDRSIRRQQQSVPLVERRIEALVQRSDTAPKPDVETSAKIPEQPSVAEALSDLEVAGAEAGVALESVRSTRAVGDRQLYRMTGHGGMREFCALLAAIENMNRLILIEKVRIVARPDEEMFFEVETASFHNATGGR